MRKPKPWFRKSTRSWYVQIDGVQVPLGREKQAAQDKYHQLMVGRRNGRSSVGRVDTLLDDFLEYVKHNQAVETYRLYRRYLRAFNETIPDRRVHDLTPHDVQKWVDAHKWNPSTRACAIRTVKRAFNWAVDQGLIQVSPIARLRKPAPLAREILISPDQWKAILALAREPLRDILTILHETGCRPEEARIVEAKDLHGDHFILTKKDSKGGRHNRLVWLTEAAQAILTRLAEKYPVGPLLRTKRGQPWTGPQLVTACHRIAKRLNIPFCAYTLRHTWITTGLERGVDAVTMSVLAGHRDTSMVAKVYSHLAGNAAHLKASMLKATGGGGNGQASESPKGPPEQS